MFDEADVISIYTDKEAIEDGVLVAIEKLGIAFKGTAIDRMTRGAYEYFREKVSGIQGEEEKEELKRIKEAVVERLVSAYDPDGDGYLIVLPAGTGEEKLWLVRNERNYTILFPSEY